MSKPKQPVADRQTELTFKTAENIRGVSSVWQELLKAANNYSRQQQKLAEAGKQLSDALQRVSQLHQGDIGEAFLKIASIQRSVEGKRDTLVRTIDDDFVKTVQKSLKPEETELARFESDYKKSRASLRDQIRKLEETTKKAGKKGPEFLKQSISALNDKIKEADQMKVDKLRQALLLERKKFCSLLTQWNTVIAAEIDVGNEETLMRAQEANWRNIASSSQQLPADLDALLKVNQERTFVTIQPEGEGGSSYADSYLSDAYNYDSSYDNQSYDAGYGSGSVTALYDYAGTQAEDLSFYAGDIITLTRDDDGSGWMEGEIHGQRGIFPSSYVQK